MDGIINIYKEKGYTSHDVVAKMRGILKQKKIGHTGTLDPEAMGVLPVCLGAATKLCDSFMDKSKCYEAVLLLGVETDTEDTTGTVLNESEAWKSLTEKQVMDAVLSFVGEYSQIPPMYSALKVNGRKLYEYARKGIEVEREPRNVTIYDISDVKINLPEVRMSVSCSKGTYIRTLCADIGKRLGCGGCMKELIRTRVGSFLIKDSLTLSKLEEKVSKGALSDVLISVDGVFGALKGLKVTPAGEKYLLNGNPVSTRQVEAYLKEDESLTLPEGDYSRSTRIYDTSDNFIGIYDLDEGAGLYTPKKLFFAGRK